MTLSAKFNNQIYYSIDISDEFGKQNKFTCIGCNGELTYHRDIAGIKTQHWAHKVPCSFETEPETQEHIKLKNWIYKKAKVEKKYLPDSFFIQNQKPDLFFEDNGKQIAVEIQCSKISYETWLQRTRDYTSKGIYVFWILGNKWLKGDLGRKRISIIEKALHQLNYGHLYYSTSNISLDIKKYRFDSCFGESDWDGGYIWRLKSTKHLINRGTINVFRFSTFDNVRNGEKFLLAEFTPYQTKEWYR